MIRNSIPTETNSLNSKKNSLFSKNFFRKEFFLEHTLLFSFMLLLILLSIFVPSFFTIRNILNIFRQSSTIGIIACGLTLVLIGGSVDLSVGSVAGLAGVLAISFLYRSLWLAILIPLLIAALIGFLNGLIVTKFKVDSVIVTLGSLAIVRGLALIYTNGGMIDGISGSPFLIIAGGSFFRVSNQIIVLFFIAVILTLLLHKFRFGRHIFCVGSNFEASRVVGISSEKVKIITFIISAVCAAISSILIASRLNTASPLTGNGFEFDAITAVIIGGTSLFGGRGSLPKTILGVLFIAVLANAMVLLNLHFSFQYMLKACMLVLFVYLDIKIRGT